MFSRFGISGFRACGFLYVVFFRFCVSCLYAWDCAFLCVCEFAYFYLRVVVF